ncbi:Nop14-like protein [Delitschia confertaspora ATCC 74209]|uniref:Nop14-like protein n=1 Tax=Delitschia confertaspora ATCC 74209 TaxID=1513339 RepID=A0A9P4JQA3_9PLEO|nr:Nop14-like protein [Delitschia confertaspora ATCC 74209]
MPPSQLKRLKASLREQGITGPQKSKKEKKNNRKGDNADQRAKKHAALASIRESFNPFEFKHLARPKKFEVTTNRPQNGKVVLGRPGVSKSQGEELRRKTLLPELHKKNKIGGILDRRIGENDPTMTLDDKMMARFTREQEKKKGVSVFDLEEAEDEFELTHGGQAVQFEAEDDDVKDDYDAASLAGSSDEEAGMLRRKRRRDSDAEGEDDAEGGEDKPERKKSKAEVMKEVIAKSKLHKYERQQAKEDDDELREELDKDLPNVLAALRGHIMKPPPPPPTAAAASTGAPKSNDFSMNADRAALLAGNKTREQADKEYDVRVRQMLQDQRAKPTERTKTEEEKAKEEAKRLKELEEKRLRRMKGEEESESEEDLKEDNDEDEDEEESEADDAKEFGLPSVHQGTRPEGVEDEDDFLMDDDLIATDSEADMSDEEEEDDSEDDALDMDDDDEFLKDVRPESSKPKDTKLDVDGATPGKLAYTYPCPQDPHELVEVLKDVEYSDYPVVIVRIRTIYHPGLASGNKEKLGNFACALVDHISYMASHKAPLAVVEQVIRHIHSLSRTYPVEIATRFRHQLKLLLASNDPTAGDLAILTAIGTIYPTSDHFHQVVTPAITLMARWLGLSTPQGAKDIATGAYLGALCIKYQAISKRYIPELVRYTNLALKSAYTTTDLLKEHTKNLLSMADLWASKSAFYEIFAPSIPILAANNKCKSAHQRLSILLNNATLHRRPLELHHHRPLPIKSNIPKFEENFDPNKHYDPDKDRAEANRLRKEFKREKKGAMRELRKDAHFIAREQLKEKKERDRRYEEKYRRLVAEIQGEEGREKNAYEREKEKRERAKGRS